ncbi:MAG TPA: agmatinase [Vicinamibacterales bacterium]|nr:agmatinase [Vicinamibacterales bacterium]
MDFPAYDRAQPQQFGGALPEPRTLEASAAVILPIPFERTTSYGHGTRYGPREILAASSQVELWDEELGVDIHARGLFTLPEMDLSAVPIDEAMAAVTSAARALLEHGKFVVALGGEHSITSALVAAAAALHPGLGVLQLDAHADLRDGYLGEHHSHASAMRRSLAYAPVVQVGIRNISTEEIAALPGLATTIFYDWNMRDDPAWMDRVIEALPPTVYLTIDLDGLDPAIMPAVGTPEPGGFSWRETTTLLRRLFERRHVVACDVVELCPLPGLTAPNFLAARLVYKILNYRLGLGR